MDTLEFTFTVEFSLVHRDAGLISYSLDFFPSGIHHRR